MQSSGGPSGPENYLESQTDVLCILSRNKMIPNGPFIVFPLLVLLPDMDSHAKAFGQSHSIQFCCRAGSQSRKAARWPLTTFRGLTSCGPVAPAVTVASAVTVAAVEAYRGHASGLPGIWDGDGAPEGLVPLVHS